MHSLCAYNDEIKAYKYDLLYAIIDRLGSAVAATSRENRCRRFRRRGPSMKELQESFRADGSPLVWTATVKREWTLSSAFEHFGAVRSPRHFGGSAISGDGRTVVVAMWEDEIVRHGDRATYQSRFGPALKGNSKRIS